MRICNHRIGFTNLLCFVSYMLISTRIIAGQTCYNTGNFTANSTYAKNRNLFLSSLASNVTVNGGYYKATIGQDPDRVYGLTLCRGDSTPESCASCVNFTIHDMMTNCPNQKEAISWGGMDFPCVVHYSNHSIFGKLELKPMDFGYNAIKITSNFTLLDEKWGSLMDRLLVKASSGTSRLKYATEEVNLTNSKMIYALMQCTPDLSRSDCDFCLRNITDYTQSCWYGSQGGYVLGPSCIFRWELYPFYIASVSALSPSPLSAPKISAPSSTNTANTKDKGGIASGIIIIIVVSTIIFIIVLALFTWVFVRRRKQNQGIKNKHERKDADEIHTAESLQFDFSTIRDATNDFSTDNKLGQGGFGSVYKGKLPHGQEIAVKRLSKSSVQGDLEFKNEVLLVARLQHRNLFRLLGFCFEGTERLLIYEFVPNSSLDNFIFDPIKRVQLDWET